MRSCIPAPPAAPAARPPPPTAEYARNSAAPGGAGVQSGEFAGAGTAGAV